MAAPSRDVPTTWAAYTEPPAGTVVQCLRLIVDIIGDSLDSININMPNQGQNNGYDDETAWRFGHIQLTELYWAGRINARAQTDVFENPPGVIIRELPQIARTAQSCFNLWRAVFNARDPHVARTTGELTANTVVDAVNILRRGRTALQTILNFANDAIANLANPNPPPQLPVPGPANPVQHKNTLKVEEYDGKDRHKWIEWRRLVIIALEREWADWADGLTAFLAGKLKGEPLTWLTLNPVADPVANTRDDCVDTVNVTLDLLAAPYGWTVIQNERYWDGLFRSCYQNQRLFSEFIVEFVNYRTRAGRGPEPIPGIIDRPYQREVEGRMDKKLLEAVQIRLGENPEWNRFRDTAEELGRVIKPRKPEDRSKGKGRDKGAPATWAVYRSNKQGYKVHRKMSPNAPDWLRQTLGQKGFDKDIPADVYNQMNDPDEPLCFECGDPNHIARNCDAQLIHVREGDEPYGQVDEANAFQKRVWKPTGRFAKEQQKKGKGKPKAKSRGASSSQWREPAPAYTPDTTAALKEELTKQFQVLAAGMKKEFEDALKWENVEEA